MYTFVKIHVFDSALNNKGTHHNSKVYKELNWLLMEKLFSYSQC